jgi:hypothetical protein
LLARAYQIDAVARKQAALSAAAKSARTVREHRLLAESWRQVIEEAVALERYDQAASQFGFLLAAAHASQDKMLETRSSSLVQEVKELQAAYQQAEPAKAALEADPADGAAALAWGRFLCLYRNDWLSGLPLLAEGSDAHLASLARADLDATQSAASALQAGDGWWELSKSQSERLPQQLLLARAALWYRQARPQQTDVVKMHVENRLKELDDAALTFPKGEWVDILPLVDHERHRVTGAWQRRGDEIVTGDHKDDWRFMLPVSIQGSYELEVRYTLLAGTQFDVVIPVGDRDAAIVTGAWGGVTSGIHTIDGRGGDANSSTARNPPIALRQRHKLEVRVLTSGSQPNIAVDLDDRRLIRWQGPNSSLSADPLQKMPRLDVPGIRAGLSNAVVHSVRLKLNSGSVRLLEE